TTPDPAKQEPGQTQRTPGETKQSSGETEQPPGQTTQTPGETKQTPGETKQTAEETTQSAGDQQSSGGQQASGDEQSASTEAADPPLQVDLDSRLGSGHGAGSGGESAHLLKQAMDKALEQAHARGDQAEVSWLEQRRDEAAYRAQVQEHLTDLHEKFD